MNDDYFEIPEYYILRRKRHIVSLEHGTGLALRSLLHHTEDGTGITEEEILDEVRNSRRGQRILIEGTANLEYGHPNNRARRTLYFLRSNKEFPDGLAVELRNGRWFLTTE